MERIDIDSGSARLACHKEGRGPTIVLLHAGVADGRSWADLQRALASSYRTVAYDRRGFGESIYQFEPFSHAGDLSAVIARAGGEDVVLVGNSMGGALAIDFALEHTDLVRALVLIGTAVTGAPELDVDTEEETRIEAAIQAAETRGDVDEVNRLEAWLWLDGGGQPEGRVVDPTRALFLDMNRAALLAPDPGEEETAGAAFDRLENLKQPVLLMVGDLDITYTRELNRIMTRRLPNAQSVIVTGVAHLPQMEEPQLIAGLIDEFVSNLDQT